MVKLKNKQNINKIIETLASLGVTRVFGCEDETLMEMNSDVQYVRLKQEHAAVHAADGYARTTGKPGVVLINSAAGVAKAITGIATAHSDSVPLLVITGQFFFEKMSNDAFQQLDIIGMTMPITKHAVKTANVEELLAVMPQLYEISGSDRPAPVLIEMLTENMAEQLPERVQRILQPQVIPEMNENYVQLAVDEISRAQKPVFFIGGGVIQAGASELLTEIIERSNIPVVSSLMGIGSLDVKNPLFLGMLGMHGTFAANKAVHQCDLLINVGVRFSDRVTGKMTGFSPKSTKIHVDIDPAEINKIVPVDYPIVGDAKEFFAAIKDKLAYDDIHKNTDVWVNEVTHWKRTVPLFDTSASVLSPQKVIQMLDEKSPDDAIIVTDVGQHQIWTAHNYAFTMPRTFLTSGGLGTMGYGLPAAIGAASAAVDDKRQVICISGDGSIQMNMQELMTAVKYQLPLKIAILNNGYLGMVRQWQEMFYDKRYSSVKMSAPDFAQVAESYGMKGLSAKTEAEARDIIVEALQHDGPVLMEFDVVEEENVYPIVPPNTNNHELIIKRDE